MQAFRPYGRRSGKPKNQKINGDDRKCIWSNGMIIVANGFYKNGECIKISNGEKIL